MRFICTFLLGIFIILPVGYAADSDCWEKTGQDALDACSHIINSNQSRGQAYEKGVLAKAYFHRGNVYFIKRNYLRAIDNYDRAIGLNPNYLKAYHIRGNAYYILGDYAEALANFDQVVRIDPSYKAVTYYRQQVKKKLQEMKK